MKIVTFDKLVGLETVKRSAKICIDSAMKRRTVMPPILLWGPPGTGKTTVANAVANEAGYHIHCIQADAIGSRKHLLESLSNGIAEAKANDRKLVFFIDEIHQLSGRLQEALFYPLTHGKVMGREGVTDLEPFTLIAATTRSDMLDSAFLSRFPEKWQLERYTDEQIRLMLHRWLQSEGYYANHQALQDIAKRCFGIPRDAMSLARKCRDYLLHVNDITLEQKHVAAVCDMNGIDDTGLTTAHRSYLAALYRAQGVPLRLTDLAISLELHRNVLTETIEPLLIRLGFVRVTTKGRELTPAGYSHLATQDVEVLK